MSAATGSSLGFVSHGRVLSEESGFPSFLRTIATEEKQTDAKGESFINLKTSGWVADDNTLEPIGTRQRLWNKYPQLEGRAVIFDFAEPLLDEMLVGFERGVETIVITGTPGIGKSAIRNIHAHFLLSGARKRGEACSVIFAKGGENAMVHLHVTASGDLHAEEILADDMWASDGYRNFSCKPGKSLFVLADISNGNIGSLKRGGLVWYTSPNQDVMNHYSLKQQCLVLGYPLLTKEQVLRYKDAEMEDRYEKYGGLACVVWGSSDDVRRHTARINEDLESIDHFLYEAGIKYYLEGPHRYWYAELQKDDEGNFIYDLSTAPPTVVSAPRHVVRIVARRVVEEMFIPNRCNHFGGLAHRAVDGILLEEVWTILLGEHYDKVTVTIRSLDKDNLLAWNGFTNKKELKLRQTTVCRVRPTEMLNALGDLSEAKLISPLTATFPGIDALQLLVEHFAPKKSKRKRTPVTKCAVCCTQFINAWKHPVSNESIDLLKRIEATTKNGRRKRHCLLFVVPERAFPFFQQQKAKDSSRQEELNSISQYVACLTVKK